MEPFRGIKLIVFALVLVLVSLALLDNSSRSAGAGQTLSVPGDCAQIQDCIARAAEGSTIMIAAGDYKGNLTISKSLTLEGRGADVTTLTAKDAKVPVLSIAGGRDLRVTLSGVKLTASKECSGGSAPCPALVLIRGAGQVVLRQVKLASSGGDGLDLHQAAQVLLEQSDISQNANWGVTVGDQAELTGRHLLIVGNGSGGLSVADQARVTLSDAQITDNQGMGALTHDSAHLSLQESLIEGNQACGLFALAQGQISGVHNVMQDNGTDLCGGAPASLRLPLVAQTVRRRIAFPGDYKTLQEAVDALIPGGTITLAPGEYQAGLTLWKPLTLVGAEPGQVTLVGRNGQSPVISIVSGAQGVRLEGLTLSGGLWGVLAGGQGELALDHVRVQKNGDGITLRDAAQMVIENSQITKNTFNGLSLLGAARLTLRDSVVQENDHWGIALIEPPCFLGKTAFSGRVSGGANRVQSNGQKLSGAERAFGDKSGNFCPQELDFLRSLNGGSY